MITMIEYNNGKILVFFKNGQYVVEKPTKASLPEHIPTADECVTYLKRQGIDTYSAEAVRRLQPRRL